jgi:hypothetical protein
MEDTKIEHNMNVTGLRDVAKIFLYGWNKFHKEFGQSEYLLTTLLLSCLKLPLPIAVQ